MNRGDHPHSTYAHGGRGGVASNKYNCVRGRRGISKLRTYAKKSFFTTKSQNFPFFTKEAITLPFIIVYRKEQPVLSYK